MKERQIHLALMIVAHLAGSYGIVLWDRIENYDLPISWITFLEAPVTPLSWLFDNTLDKPTLGLITFWAAYLVPASSVFAIHAIRKVAMGRQERQGFEVIGKKK